MGGFGDFYGRTVIHPLGLTAVFVLGIALVLLPRRWAFLPMLILACFIPSAQRIIVAGADFNLLRILILFGWVRIVLRNEMKGLVWNRLDFLLIAWMVSGSIIYTIQYGTSSALVNRLGWMFDGFGMYFLFRCVIRSWEDLEQVAWSFVLVSLPVAVAFLIEWSTGRNAFAIFGGVPAITNVREGRLRCQGAFSHAILAGSFWVSVMPFMMALWFKGRRWLVVSGLAAAFVITFTCASSTPVLALGFVVLGMALYPFRHQLSYIRWSIVGVLVFLHFIMAKPIWHLLARVSAVGGSTGWHRYMIIDATINNWDEWVLLGEPNPMSWGVWQMRDITNQYILEGLRGGLLALALFVATLWTGFRMIGSAIRQYESDKPRQVFVWCVGVALFTHAGVFIAVSYFGQIIMLLYLTLALAASVYNLALTEKKAEEQSRLVSTGSAHVQREFKSPTLGTFST